MAEIPLRRRSPVSLRDCNLSKSFELIGDRWTLLILRSAFWGVRRFDDFQAELDVPRSVLSSRLAGLVDAGIMEKREYREEGQRARVEYPLTDMGRELGLPFFAITAWGDKWLAEGEPHFGLQSRANGQKLRVMLVDERGKPVKPEDIQYVVDKKVWPQETLDGVPDKPRRKSG
jgi:DNA-binding HxlR family transcriptional regulator